MKTCMAALAALAVATPLAAQTSFGVRGGMTYSTLVASPDEPGVDVSYLTGIHLGIVASMGSGGPGLLLSAAYAQRGALLASDDFGQGFEATVDLAYLDVGAFGRIPIGSGPYLFAGPTLGLRLECSTTYTAEGVNVSVDCGGAEEADPYRAFDFGVSGGAGMSFGVGGLGVVVEALYGFGILDIVDDDSAEDTVTNRGLTIRAGVDVGR